MPNTTFKRGDGRWLRKKALLGSVTVVVLLVAATAALAANFTDPVNGTRGPDTINGTPKADRIDGRGGDDTINGRGGGDKIRGGSGDDRIHGDRDCTPGSQGKPYYCI